MAETTKIQWAHSTFNPWRGCTKVSPGCAHCYADTQSRRNPGVLGVWGPNGTRVIASEAMWREPVKWNREATEATARWAASHQGKMACDEPPPERPRVFCASLADIFEGWPGQMTDSQGHSLVAGPLFHPTHEGGPWWMPSGEGPRLDQAHVLFRLFNLIRQTPNLDWLLLTKRPQNIIPGLAAASRCVYGGDTDETLVWLAQWAAGSPPANVWLGTSVEDQQRADERIPELLKVPARVRFLSCEPLLGPVDLTAVQTSSQWPGKREPSKLDALRGFTYSRRKPFVLGGITEEKGDVPYVDLHDVGRIGWVIVGGESGSQARFCDVDWIRSLVQQCKAAAVPVFVKQLGACPAVRVGPDGQPEDTWQLSDPKGGDPAEWPEDLRVREVPEVQP